MKDGDRVKQPERLRYRRQGDGLCTRVAVVSGHLGREAMVHVRWPGYRRAYGLPARLVEVVR